MTHLQKQAKIILYRLAKQMNQKFCHIGSCVENRSRTESEKNSDKQTLIRLKKKGLVGMTEYTDGNIYYLTDEGEKMAKSIVEEIDEYKRW